MYQISANIKKEMYQIYEKFIILMKLYNFYITQYYKNNNTYFQNLIKKIEEYDNKKFIVCDHSHIPTLQRYRYEIYFYPHINNQVFYKVRFIHQHCSIKCCFIDNTLYMIRPSGDYLWRLKNKKIHYSDDEEVFGETFQKELLNFVTTRRVRPDHYFAYAQYYHFTFEKFYNIVIVLSKSTAERELNDLNYQISNLSSYF